MKVLYVTSEAYPLLKTGGLADVSGALPAALAEAGVDVRIMLPAYPQALEMAEDMRPAIDFGYLLGVGQIRLIRARMPVSGVPLWLVDCPSLYARGGNPYVQENGSDWPDNGLRFAVLSRAAALLSVPGNVTGWTADIVHGNDWQSGLSSAYLHFMGGHRARSVFTIHNLQYQGLFEHKILSQVGLPEEAYSVDGLEFYGEVSFLKAGLYYSDAITTVSPTYAMEIQTEELGCGMDGLLRMRKGVLSGILNGIDDHVWNPETDPNISHHYNVARLAEKKLNKVALQREMGLPVDDDAPLFCVVSRLTEQKGIDLIAHASAVLRKLGVQLAILGTGDLVLQNMLNKMAADDEGIAVKIGYNDPLAHRMMAGADVLLMPSRFEPCGLTQMYAMRYGTLPLVSKTGGLTDTVIDASDKSGGTGFVFDSLDVDALVKTVQRAITLYRKPKSWQKTQRNAMSQDLSWKNAAKIHIDLYEDITTVKT
jgi:starch synthase